MTFKLKNMEGMKNILLFWKDLRKYQEFEGIKTVLDTCWRIRGEMGKYETLKTEKNGTNLQNVNQTYLRNTSPKHFENLFLQHTYHPCCMYKQQTYLFQLNKSSVLYVSTNICYLHIC